jgi:hypothetical protein
MKTIALDGRVFADGRLRVAAAFPLAVAVLLASCAHAPDPLLTAAATISFAGDQYLQTNEAVESLHRRGALTEDTYGMWLSFKARWKPAYHLAVESWALARRTGAAADSGGAWAVLQSLAEEELAVWFAMVMRIAVPDGGAP